MLSHFVCSIENTVVSMESVMVTLGQTAQLRCKINALANFTWIHKGVILPNQRKTFQTTTGILLVHTVSHNDTGGYICLTKTRHNLVLAASTTLQIGGTHIYLYDFETFFFFFAIKRLDT